MNAIVLAGLLVTGGADSPPTRYQIELRVTAVRMDAPRSEQKPRIVAEPRVITPNGRPAFFRVGKLNLTADGINGPGVFQMLEGMEVEALPLKQPDGRVQLDLRFVPVGMERGLRSTTTMRPGADQFFQVESPKSTEVLTVEVVVTEVQPSGEK